MKSMATITQIKTQLKSQEINFEYLWQSDLLYLKLLHARGVES